MVKLYNGESVVENTRTRKRAIKRLIRLVSDLVPLEELALVHTHALDKAEALRQEARHLFPEGKVPLCVEVTPTIGAHIGPGVVGFVCITAREG